MFDHPIVQQSIELTVGFIILLIVTRFIRKTQIQQVTPFDFISSIVLGELLGNAIYDNEVKLWNIVLALLLWSFLMYFAEMITLKLRKTRKVIEGKPSIIIRNGQIDYKVLNKEKIDINELLSMLRQKDAFSVREIEYAILEQSGNISILKKSKYDTPTMEDMNLPNKAVNLPVSLIIDGELLKNQLQALGFDEDWLNKQLHKFAIKNVKDVFFAEWKKDEGLHIVTRN
jgi:uncharacterized membrane protein YcaP (DUF421 family)